MVCLIAHGIFINRQCNDETIGAVMVSLLPTGFAQIQPKTLNLAVLSKMAKWFCSAFPLGNRQVIPMATCNYWVSLAWANIIDIVSTIYTGYTFFQNTRLLTAIESKSVVDFKEAAMVIFMSLRRFLYSFNVSSMCFSCL